MQYSRRRGRSLRCNKKRADCGIPDNMSQVARPNEH
jgi:hypothetical protein